MRWISGVRAQVCQRASDGIRFSYLNRNNDNNNDGGGVYDFAFFMLYSKKWMPLNVRIIRLRRSIRAINKNEKKTERKAPICFLA